MENFYINDATFTECQKIYTKNECIDFGNREYPKNPYWMPPIWHRQS